MKVYFGFNDIRQDGMGSAAMTLLRALRDAGFQAQSVHPWRKIDVPEYFEFNPTFVSDSDEEKPLPLCIKQMVDVVNRDLECKIFSHFGSPNWGAIVPYLREDIRVVVSVHSITPSATKIALANAERVSQFVPVSWAVEARLKKLLPKSDHWKISRVPNAVDVNAYPVKTEFEHQGKCRIVYLGRIEDYTKGCDKIPKIAQQLKKRGLSFEWDMYGYFHWNYEQRFYKQLESHGVQDVVHYKGCINPDQVRSMLGSYDIMVMPSNHEGLPISLLDSMALGLTCVVSRLENVTDRIIETKRNGILVGRNDISGFAEAIMQAATNVKLREAIGIAARKTVEQHFSIKQHGEDYRAVFERALADTSYRCTPPRCSLDNFQLPDQLKSHLLARILPNVVKRFLKKHL